MTRTSDPQQIAVGEKFLLIWWAYTATCDRWYPHRALRLPPGSAVFVGHPPRPRAAGVGGKWTFDADGSLTGGFAYGSPLLERRPTMPHREIADVEPMSAYEFFEMYDAMPVRRPGEPDPAGYERFLEWARTRPELSGKSPACFIAGTALARLAPPEGAGPARDGCRRHSTG